MPFGERCGQLQEHTNKEILVKQTYKGKKKYRKYIEKPW